MWTRIKNNEKLRERIKREKNQMIYSKITWLSFNCVIEFVCAMRILIHNDLNASHLFYLVPVRHTSLSFLFCFVLFFGFVGLLEFRAGFILLKFLLEFNAKNTE